jgi:hypothetical protein
VTTSDAGGGRIRVSGRSSAGPGEITLAKHGLEFLASLSGVIGGLTALATRLL